MGVPLIAGREFNGHDDAQAPKVALINQTAARWFWPGQDPIGKHVRVGNLPAPVEVADVLGDSRNVTLAVRPAPEMFLPFPQLPWTILYFDVRTTVEPHTLIHAVRREIVAVDRDQPITEIYTGEELLQASAGQTRIMMCLVGVFAAIAFLLAAVGIYGAIAYTVAQRTQELGIRVALGASSGDILRLVIGNGLVLAACGIVIGLGGSMAVTRLMTAMLYDTSAADPLTFFASAALFISVAAIASYLPARGAMRVDPTHALRAE